MSTYETIKLDDYIQTGEGGTAQAYTRKDGKTLAKLYNPGFEADRAAAEFFTARTVFEMGIPTPEPYRKSFNYSSNDRPTTAHLRAISEGTGFLQTCRFFKNKNVYLHRVN